MRLTLTRYPTSKPIEVDISKDDVKALAKGKVHGFSVVNWNNEEILVYESESRIKRMIDGVK